jgi:predicted transcriptional regulator
MSMSVTHAIRASRRKAAEERQAVYDKLSLAEKLARLPAEPKAAKVRAKLLAQDTKKFKASVEEGLKDVAESNVKPHEEVKKKFKKGN